MVSEMNLKYNHAYQSIFLSPLSFESPFYFYFNIAGMFISSLLIEKVLGPKFLLFGVLFNACVSSVATLLWHRHIGYYEVKKRGRTSNHNGNIGVFLSVLFAILRPGFSIYQG